MKHLITSIFILLTIASFAVTASADTPITEKYMLLLIQKDVPIAERRAYVNNMNQAFSTYTTNSDKTVTTNYFIKFLDTDNNAQGAFTQEPDVKKHSKIVDKKGVEWNSYLWYGDQCSKKLTKEVLSSTETAIGKNKINVFYPDEDFTTWMKKNEFTYVTNSVTPGEPK